MRPFSCRNRSRTRWVALINRVSIESIKASDRWGRQQGLLRVSDESLPPPDQLQKDVVVVVTRSNSRPDVLLLP